MQAFAERGPEDGAGDDDLVTQLRSRRNMLGDLIAAKDLQVRQAVLFVFLILAGASAAYRSEKT
jgi:hypothetical protein